MVSIQEQKVVVLGRKAEDGLVVPEFYFGGIILPFLLKLVNIYFC